MSEALSRLSDRNNWADVKIRVWPKAQDEAPIDVVWSGELYRPRADEEERRIAEQFYKNGVVFKTPLGDWRFFQGSDIFSIRIDYDR